MADNIMDVSHGLYDLELCVFFNKPGCMRLCRSHKHGLEVIQPYKAFSVPDLCELNLQWDGIP